MAKQHEVLKIVFIISKLYKMTNQSVQKLLTFLLFLWSCTLVWATTAPPGDQVYVSQEAITKGLDKIYITHVPTEAQPIEAVSGASVYILPNTGNRCTTLSKTKLSKNNYKSNLVCPEVSGF